MSTAEINHEKALHRAVCLNRNSTEDLLPAFVVQIGQLIQGFVTVKDLKQWDKALHREMF